jgi:orotate phosphoribosyltransferase
MIQLDASVLLDAIVRLGYRSDPTGFKLSSGVTSTHYIDCRTVMAHPRWRATAARLLSSRIPCDVEAIAGVPMGGVALATTLSDMLGLPLIIPRAEAKSHGTRASIEGPPPPLRVVLVDDVMTSGGSLLRAATQLRDAGYAVMDAYTLVQRGGAPLLSQYLIDVNALFDENDIVTAVTP